MNNLMSRPRAETAAPMPPIDAELPNLGRLYLMVRRGSALALASAGVGLLLGWLYLTFANPNYEAHALILMQRDAAGAEDADIAAPGTIDDAQLQNQLEVIRSREIAADVLAAMGGPEAMFGPGVDARMAIDELRDWMSVARIDASYVFALYYIDPDPEMAARVANAYADAYVAHQAREAAAALETRRRALARDVDDLRRAVATRQAELLAVASGEGSFDESVLRRNEIEQLLENDRVAYDAALARLRTAEQRDFDAGPLRATLLSDAVAPELSTAPKPFMILTLAAFLGLACGGGLALARENADDTLRTGDDIRGALGQNFIGYLPRMPRGRRRPGAKGISLAWRFAAEAPRSRYAETLRFARARLAARQGRETGLVLGISAIEAEASASQVRAETSANFALLLAAEGGRVLLIDADSRAGTLTTGFGRDGSPDTAPSLVAALADPEAVARVVTGAEGIGFLPAHSAREAVPLYIGAEAFARVIEAARPRFDFVIVDLPSPDTAAYTRPILAVLDGWMAVARWGVTTRHTAHATLRNDAGARRNLLGVVLADSDMRRLRDYAPARDIPSDV